MKHLLRLFFDSGPSIDTWTLFYENSVITKNHTENEILSPTVSGNYYVTTCLFNGINDIVVNISKGDQTKLLISISGFNGTKTPSFTVFSYKGSCVIYRTCATKSIQTSSNEGVFLYSFASNTNNKNIFEDSTVFDCGDSIDKGNSINDLRYGNLSYSRNNITNNKCYRDVSLEILSYQRYNISQSSFIDNKANHECFYIGSSGPHQFYLCNIIRNNATYQCFQLSYATVTFDSCSIKNNNCRQTFYIHSSPSLATIINCDYELHPANNVVVQNPINNFYNELSHLSTGLCEAANKIENNLEKENDIKKFNQMKNFCISQYLILYQRNHFLFMSHILTFSFLSLTS